MDVKIFVFNQFSENTYVLYDETKEAVIIDCGATSQGEKAELKAFIDDNRLNVKFFLNTHLHLDHIFGMGFVYKTFHVKPQYNSFEEQLPSLAMQAKNFGIQLPEEQIPVEKYLNEGDKIEFGNSILEVIWVPGHSPGSLCFYSRKDGCLISGDVLFQGSIGRTDLWGGDYQLLLRGISEKLMILPGTTLVYPGHGPATTIQHEKDNNPFLKERLNNNFQ